MMKLFKNCTLLIILTSFVMFCGCDTVKSWFGSSTKASPSGPQVKVETSMGDFIIQLDTENTPLTTANFLENVKNKVYENTLVHEVLQQRTIVAGGFKPESGPPASGLFANEAAANLPNLRGTIAMLHPEDQVQTDSMQFIINVLDNPYLNVQNMAEGQTVHTPETCGYCVFGNIIQGMDVIESIAKTPVEVKYDFECAPATDITILKMSVIE